MVAAQAHRGPDGDGIHFYDTCGLGHRRLSIVDLACGAQPMFSPAKDVAIVFNGEIYGFQEIRAGIRDYAFTTTSDTEVMLALYSRHGSDMLSQLPGMFAFALWDEQERAVLCPRSFREKPSTMLMSKDGYLFASEIKSILRH
jgi:asparagine synthase (glutamine-hydrolysing)